MQGFSYDELAQALQDWPQENSSEEGEYVNNIPRIISLGELRLVKDLNLDIFDHIAYLPLSQGDFRLSKPEDWIATRGMWRYTGTFEDAPNVPRIPLHQRSLGFLRRYGDPSAEDAPLYFNEISEDEFEFQQPADDDYTVELHYIRRPPGLTDENQNTWLGDKVGDVLFVACLMEAEHFIKADDRYADMKTKYYEEMIPVARAELRSLIRSGSYDPIKSAAKTVE